MKSITEAFRNEIIETVVREFGNGEFRPTKYLFEQITRLPSGFSHHRMKAGVAIGRLAAAKGECVVIFDPHPNNRRAVRAATERIGMTDTSGFFASPGDVERLLSFHDCDIYVTSETGRLLIVGCHEDEIVDGERMVWVPEGG
jgi:hypothetical protein